MENKRIRNFSIIAHVDHGKSTLADVLILKCEGVGKKLSSKNLDLEEEKGITIKSKTIRFNYNYKGENYILNLIDTPGHVDFSYEVSRALSACEISILVIDSTKGVEAQTISNFIKAKENHHFIIPTLNKIDMNNADIDSSLEDLKEWKIDIKHLQLVSAKTGEGVEDLLKTLVEFGPPPEGKEGLLRALVIDSWYDPYQGVIALIRIKDGTLKKATKIVTYSNKKVFLTPEIGILSPNRVPTESLNIGEIGYIVTKLKNPDDIRIGDTMGYEGEEIEPLPGFEDSLNTVFCTFYPSDPSRIEHCHNSLKKLRLNDPSYIFEVENSDIHGIGFRCGFHGLLHLETVKERLKREYDAHFITTPPTVPYRITLRDQKVMEIKNPSEMPEKNLISKMEEPETLCTIFTSNESIGGIKTLCNDKRAVDLVIISSDEKRSVIKAKIPLAEIITDFTDKLYSISSGYASFNYQSIGYRESDLTKLLTVINDKVVEEFTLIVHESKKTKMATVIAAKLKELIPRSQISIKIQICADTKSKIIAREDISPFRKNVLAKCYGGDRTRKDKLLNKQKEGKEKMKELSLSQGVSLDIKDLSSAYSGYDS